MINELGVEEIFIEIANAQAELEKVKDIEADLFERKRTATSRLYEVEKEIADLDLQLKKTRSLSEKYAHRLQSLKHINKRENV